MYHVYWTNHGYFSERTFTCLGDALEYGKSKCMDFSVWGAARTQMFASWSIFGGMKFQ